MWTLFFLLLLQGGPTPCQTPPAPTESPSLIVQVVDPAWYPIPGAGVTVRPLTGHSLPNSGLANNQGYANFSAPGDADYAIEVKKAGYKSARLRSLHLFKSSGPFPTAYVQIRLQVSGPTTTVY